MTRKFLEEMGFDKNSIDRVLDEHSTGIGKLKSEIMDLKKENGGLAENLRFWEQKKGEFENISLEKEVMERRIQELENGKVSLLEEINGLKIENALDRSLTKAGARNLKAAKALINKEGLSLSDDGTVLGLEGEIDKLTTSEDTTFLFSKNAEGGFKGVKPFEKGDVKADISAMTYSQYLAAGGQ